LFLLLFMGDWLHCFKNLFLYAQFPYSLYYFLFLFLV